MHVDRYANSSALKNINPLLKILFSIATLIICINSSKIEIFILIWLIMFFLVTYIGKTPVKYWFKLMGLPLFFMIVSLFSIMIEFSYVIPNGFTYLKIASLYIFITKSGVDQAVIMFFKSLGAVSCLYFLILTTCMNDMIYALNKIKIPNIIIEQFTLVYRFIFIILDKSTTKLKSQQTRFAYTKLKGFTYSFGTLFGSVFIQSYLSSKAVYNSMISRGYGGEYKILQKDYDLPVKFIVFIVLSEIIFIGLNFI